MILPTKHISLGRSLLGQAQTILSRIREATALTELWDETRELEEIPSFPRFVLALDLLYAVGLIEMRSDGLITASSSR